MSARVQDKLVLVGAESSRKSSLFRGLTGRATGDEANFRGPTVVCCRVAQRRITFRQAGRHLRFGRSDHLLAFFFTSKP